MTEAKRRAIESALAAMAGLRSSPRPVNTIARAAAAESPEEREANRPAREEKLREVERRLREDPLNDDTRAALQQRVRLLRELISGPAARASAIAVSAPKAAAPKPPKAQPTKEQLADAAHKLVLQHRVLVAQRAALARGGRLTPAQFARLQVLRAWLPDEHPKAEPPSAEWKLFADSLTATTAELAKLNPA